MQAKTEAEVL